ncbi:TPA: fibronectin-binding protein SfbI [Streptococcus pyogenes]|uniref:fibronectin-binding protein PrtF1/SfbI n=1 Tax=Streptococcus pyogenes TaxID=1314 RepID=UPI0003B991F3|nr:fibronectin-binding protein PrtF1/SfbI [Streptococcus pyogenes]ESA49641.1 fibronectin-binding signal sequence domain protein [Streptococcus pyogenes GA19700]HER4585599.1 fibronectin-binding protein SfbI [Streptococcus pyogenes NGAS618]NTS49039.1 fibronectin-binding protein SfbI [Streptococcus pyogenes]VHI77771.1 fibronectin-binding protein [Streptococcus pyogenes]HEP1968113.1 fibronectin-binding protein SfbI [Streptococcus pyogenes]
MNNKIFLNKEASFLAHTKRKRRFAVTLVGVFFMLLACAGAIGFGQVAYAADEKTVPSHSSPNPEFPWYGYDAYGKEYPGYNIWTRYHDLRVNLNGSRSYQVYCFNIQSNYPSQKNSFIKNWFKKIEGNGKSFVDYAHTTKLGKEELEQRLLSLLYNAYPNDANGYMKGLEHLNAITVTQYAVWHYSDNSQYQFETLWESEAKEGKISRSQVTLMREALKKLIDPNLEATAVNKIPSGYRLNIFESENEAYQNLLSAEYVPDDPPKPGETSEHNPKTPELDGTPIPEDPKHPDDNLEPTLPPVMLDGEEVPEVPSESLEPALPPLMPELDGQEVPEKPSIDLPIEVPRYEFNNKDQSPLAGESGETEYITEVYGNQQNPVDIDKKLPNETGFSGNMVETEDTKEPEVLMGGQSESVEFTKDTQTGMSGQTTPQVETEDTKEPEVLMGGQSESVEFTKDTQTGMSGQTTPQIETEDTKEPEVLMGGQSESVEFTKDTQTGMSGFSETATVVEDTRPKLVFHFDNNEPKVEENREKPTKNITPILPATGDIENVLAFLGILILSVLSIFSLLKNKQSNKKV